MSQTCVFCKQFDKQSTYYRRALEEFKAFKPLLSGRINSIHVAETVFQLYESGWELYFNRWWDGGDKRDLLMAIDTLQKARFALTPFFKQIPWYEAFLFSDLACNYMYLAHSDLANAREYL